jgi:hypothetical protein
MKQDITALLPMLDQLSKLTATELQGLGFTQEEVFTVEILSDPIKWAEEYLHWKCRDYQEVIMKQGAKANRMVLRLGRRLGKTECMCILILWHAFTQINRDFDKIDTDPYDILILTPYESQSKLIFKRLHELIQASPELQRSIKRDIDMRIELHNGTNIQAMTVGVNTGQGAANTRGQAADLIIYDEVDYMGEEEITNTYNIRNTDPQRIKIIAASTPSGDRRSFYRWCMEATHKYMADVEYIEQTSEVKFDYDRARGKSNGWTQIYAPSTVNKKLREVNADTGLTGLEELREEFTEMRYEQEVMANFGESESGVYQKKYIDLAIQIGEQLEVKYMGDLKGSVFQDFPKIGPRILGVDWDKKGASTNMVGLQYIEECGKFVPFCRVEIPKHEFTYSDAVQMIIKLNTAYNFDWIFCDAGHGEYQIEDLHKYGMKHPESGLRHKVVRVNMSEKIIVRDPFTMEKVGKHIKPFMVANLTIALERGQFAFNPEDKHMIRQFTDYNIVRWGQDGRPVYTDVNEHIHDCVMLAMHGFVSKYSDMLKVKTTSHISKLRPLDLGPSNKDVKDRDITQEAPKKMFSGLGISTKRHRTAGRSSYGMPSRPTF